MSTASGRSSSNDENVVSAAQRRASREAAAACQRAQKETSNKQRCLDFEQQVRDRQTTSSELTTPPPKMQFVGTTENDEFFIGAYVLVEHDLSPVKCSYGGYGFIVDIHGDNLWHSFDIKYVESATAGGSVEMGVPLPRLTEMGSLVARRWRS